MNNEWHRLPVVSLIFFFLSGIKNTVKHGYQMLPGLVSIWVFVKPVREYVPLILLVLLALFLVMVVLTFLRFTYQVSDSRVSVRRGVFNRSELNLEYERIQQADIQFPWYLRPFNLRVVRLESAGAKGSEVELVGLTLEQALSLQARVSSTDSETANSDHAENSGSSSNKSSDFSLALTNRDVWRIGLMQNPFIVLGLLVAFLNSNDAIRDWIEGKAEAFFGQFPDRTTAILIAIGLTVAVIVVVMLGSILFAVNKYYGYRLSRAGQRYHYEAGLLSTLNRGFSARKLQGVTARQGWVARALGRVNIELAQAGGIGQKKERFTIPSLTSENRARVEADLRLPQVTEWNRFHPVATFSFLFFISGLTAIFWPWWSSILVFIGLYALSIGFWLRRSWHITEQWLVTRRGLIGTTLRYMPLAKMQSIVWRQGPLQRLFNVGTLTIKSASITYHLSDIPEVEAKRIGATFVTQTRTCQLRWM
ncbi:MULTISPECIES: PH domain-containing protein [Gammaproteobacteria]|uniref:PH domain-containing protein n=1 Tax=Gammaproteobacteria TaxID=1236 RepID=UPI000DCF6451|nr:MULTISPECIES: PH domain-containing protein [Gammaproteobacteria]RTE85781.1 hypothetical protein DQX04_10040 [Aliidiomarina sp. B3213]TCZ90216.1 hypothetical protein EYQ95_10415 [Lysobacter sp. N42]